MCLKIHAFDGSTCFVAKMAIFLSRVRHQDFLIAIKNNDAMGGKEESAELLKVDSNKRHRLDSIPTLVLS
jgi:hypothetical protein